MQTFTWNQLISAVVVLGAIITGYNLLSTALKNRREQMQAKDAPITEIKTTLRDHGEKLDRDKRRLDALEDHDERLEEGIYCLMRSNLSMTRHMLHGNNIDGLNRSEVEITDFLTKKGRNDHE